MEKQLLGNLLIIGLLIMFDVFAIVGILQVQEIIDEENEQNPGAINNLEDIARLMVSRLILDFEEEVEEQNYSNRVLE